MAGDQETFKSLLRIAQIYNSKNCPHMEQMIKHILKKEDVLNQVFPASIFLQSSQADLTECTILHVAAYEREVEMFKIFLDNGTDFTRQSDDGRTILHYLFDSKLDDKRDELINYVLSAHVRFENSRNPSNSNGISHFHIACMANNTQAVHFFLNKCAIPIEQSVNMNSPKYAGYSSLHFAAEGSSIETIKLLLTQNASINVKDAQGRTPLHIFLQKKLELFDSLSKSEKDKSNDILEKINIMDDVTNLLLPNDDADDVGLSQFHIACTMQDLSVAEYLLEESVDIVNKYVDSQSPVWPGYTPLHFAAHCNMKIFKILIQRGASIEATSAEGHTPLDICYKKVNSHDVSCILKSKPKWSTAMFSDDRTQLIKLLAALGEPLTFLSYLKVAVNNINIQVVENPPFWIGWMPLHFAVLVSKDSDAQLVQLCLECQADVTIQDIHGWTPIHLAFRTKKIKVTMLLLDYIKIQYNGIEELTDKQGLSIHHIIRQLIQDSSAFELDRLLHKWYCTKNVFKTNESNPLHTACYVNDWKELNSRLNYLIKLNVNTVITCNNSTMFWSRYNGYTPLNVAIQFSSNAEIIDILLRNGADMFASRPDGMTPIYAVLKDIRYDYVINNFISELETRKNFRMSKGFVLHLEEMSGITMLHIACRTFNVKTVETLIEQGIHVNAKVHKECPIWSEYTPLHVLMWYSVYIQDQYIYEKFQNILGLLLAHRADVTAVNGEGDTPVHLSFDHCINHIQDFNFVCTSLLMDHHKGFSINPVNLKKISHFHAACIINNVEAVEKFLNRGVDVNQSIDPFVKNFAGESPLHLALKRILGTENNLKTIELLLTRGANLLAEDSYGFTVLHRAACDYSQNSKLFEKLVSCGADVNAKNIFGETPMEFLLKTDEISLECLEILLKSNCRLNDCNDISEEGYLAMIIDNHHHKTSQFKIFERMIQSEDLIITDEKGRTALHNIVTTSKPNIDIINYAEMIDAFEKLNIGLNLQDKLGKTALHLAVQFGNTQAVDALINAGADVNIVDCEDKTALSYATESRRDPDGNIIKILVVHIRKLQFLALHVDELNRHLLEKNSFSIGFDIEGLLNERKYVRDVVVDTEPLLKIDDFFLETEQLASYPFTVDSKRKKVDELLKSITKKLPELKSVLMSQYRKNFNAMVI